MCPGNPTAALVVLTTGDRPKELDAALRSALDQNAPWSDLVVVRNGCGEVDLPRGVRDVVLVENQGIPGGRNIGARATSADVIVFLDDDARFMSDDAVLRTLQLFAAQPDLGAVAYRLVDEFGETARRHVPRPGAGRPDEAGPVAGFLGGAVAIRREAFEASGGYPAEFFYSMEESDLSLGMIDSGWTIRYEPSVTVFHPRSEPARHAGHLQRSARNRVLLARRRLPAPVAAMYVFDWLALSCLRERMSVRSVGAIARGTIEGLRASTTRRPIRWSTVWALTRLGRPPIL